MGDTACEHRRGFECDCDCDCDCDCGWGHELNWYGLIWIWYIDMELRGTLFYAVCGVRCDAMRYIRYYTMPCAAQCNAICTRQFESRMTM